MSVSSAEPQTKSTEFVQAVFEGLAKLRSARVFHPEGATFVGTVVLNDPDSPTADALGGPWPVHVRASKGLGTPGEWPDVHGLAVRIVHEEGPIDLLFATAGRLVPWVLTPSNGWCDHPYTTFLPYGVGDRHVVLRLDPDKSDVARDGDVASILEAVASAPVTFTVRESHGLSWRSIGTLRLESISDEEIAFDPVLHQHPRVRHSRLLAPLRHFAYAGSRHGRGAPNQDLE